MEKTHLGPVLGQDLVGALEGARLFRSGAPQAAVAHVELVDAGRRPRGRQRRRRGAVLGDAEAHAAAAAAGRRRAAAALERQLEVAEETALVLGLVAVQLRLFVAAVGRLVETDRLGNGPARRRRRRRRQQRRRRRSVRWRARTVKTTNSTVQPSVNRIELKGPSSTRSSKFNPKR